MPIRRETSLAKLQLACSSTDFKERENGKKRMQSTLCAKNTYLFKRVCCAFIKYVAVRKYLFIKRFEKRFALRKHASMSCNCDIDKNAWSREKNIREICHIIRLSEVDRPTPGKQRSILISNFINDDKDIIRLSARIICGRSRSCVTSTIINHRIRVLSSTLIESEEG